MSRIELKHIDKFYGSNHVLRDINLLCLIGTSNFQGTYRLNTYTPIIIIAKSSDNAEVSKTILVGLKCVETLNSRT